MNKSWFIVRLFSLLGVYGLAGLALAVTPLSNDELGDVAGQGLILTEQIAGTGSGAGFTYTRMGLDANLYLNANIDKMQLGCGGFNETILSGSCDIDLDYVRLMGRYTGSGNNPNQTANGGAGRAGDAATSDFLLKRPYIEIATKGSGANRELAGIKIGSQEASGFFGVGSVNGTTHTGINTISGSLGVFINGYVTFGSGLGDGSACIGRPSTARCNDGNTDAPYELFSVPTTLSTGTRLQSLYVPGVELSDLDGSGILGIFDGRTLYAQMTTPLKQIHGFELNGTKDFFLSFQREKISYPNYDKTTYSSSANAGWWMNVPRVELRELSPAKIELGCPSLCLGLLDAFNYPGINAGSPDLKSLPPNNCYGTSRFC